MIDDFLSLFRSFRVLINYFIIERYYFIFKYIYTHMIPYKYFKNITRVIRSKGHRGFADFSIKRLAPQGRLERKILQSIMRIVELGAQERGKLSFSHCGSTSDLPSCGRNSPLHVTFSSLALSTHFNERTPTRISLCF